MTARDKTIVFWTLLIVLTVLATIYVREILLPFVAGAALAYFLDPIADRLVRAGMPRLLASILILATFAILTFLLLVTVVPFLIRELRSVITDLPAYIETIHGFFAHYYLAWTGKELPKIEFGFEEALKKLANSSSLEPGALLQNLWNSSLAFVKTASLLVITPVVAFYLLLDWDKIIDKIDSWIPREHVGTVRKLGRQVDRTLNGFVRGQITVCFILACFYSIGLLLVGLKHGLLIGVTAGVLSFIPYVGSAIGLVLSSGMAISQFWPEWIPILMVLGVFITGQLLEGNILQPKIVGDQVNLHPVWLIFALFVFGYLMGFVGMLVAVPLAATIGVLVRFMMERYLESDLYKGKPGAT